jgi:hypothetical protein
MNGREHLILSSPKLLNALPGEILSLLRQSLAHRQTGLLILGGCAAAAERRQLTITALAVTAALGPVAALRPAVAFDHTDASPDDAALENGLDPTRAQWDTVLPLFNSVTDAVDHGYRRILIDCPDSLDARHWGECLSYPPRQACLIVCVKSFDARHAFVSLTRADWNALESLIGILTWARLPGAQGPLTLCDGFTRGRRPIYRGGYEDAANALYVNRQLCWEAQAVGYLESGRIAPRTLRQQLLAWSVLDPADTEVMRDTLLEAELDMALRRWLQERVLSRHKPKEPTGAVRTPYH